MTLGQGWWVLNNTQMVVIGGPFAEFEAAEQCRIDAIASNPPDDSIGISYSDGNLAWGE